MLFRIDRREDLLPREALSEQTQLDISVPFQVLAQLGVRQRPVAVLVRGGEDLRRESALEHEARPLAQRERVMRPRLAVVERAKHVLPLPLRS